MHEKSIIRICEFARRYRSEKKRTPQQLYDETGYGTGHAKITQQDIEAVIAQDHTLIDDWLSFTEDKRWTPAWGLRKNSDRWIVFHMAEGGTRSYEVIFALPVPACALMIRMEMEDFRLRQLRK